MVTIVVLIYIYTQVFTMAIYVILSPFAMVIENEFDKQVFRKYHILRETR